MPNFVLVDNSAARLVKLAAGLSAAFPGCGVEQFPDPLLSAQYICNNPVDMALIEANMRPADGLTLLKVIRKQKPELPAVILSGDGAQREAAKALAADDYFIRPVTKEQLTRLRAYL